jgi:mono/diheme cytochrome c family protein
VPFREGKPYGAWEVFADGFAGIDTIVNTGDALHRPMGLSEGPDGSIYVVDSRKGKIWRIMYEGPPELSEKDLAAMEMRKQRSNLKTPDSIADNLFREKPIPGKRVYNTYCGTCHQRDGKGDGQRFPPLAASEWVTGDKKRLTQLILKGMKGPITVNGTAYNNVMPGFSFLRDQDIAELLSFIRSEFGNKASAITPKEVEVFRNSQ